MIFSFSFDFGHVTSTPVRDDMLFMQMLTHGSLLYKEKCVGNDMFGLKRWLWLCSVMLALALINFFKLFHVDLVFLA